MLPYSLALILRQEDSGKNFLPHCFIQTNVMELRMRQAPNKKNDYQKELEDILSQLQGKEKPSLLLHACCGPCSSYVVEYLASFFRITIYYYNPNIYPQKEYLRRKEELSRFIGEFPPAQQNSVTLVEADYNPEAFYDATHAREDPALQEEKERGERCRRCYELRLAHSFSYAETHGFDYFTTTLSISPYKDAEKINEIGKTLAARGSVLFLPSDFKKKNGFLRSLQLSKEYDMYRQDYCGCIYSLRNREKSGEEK